ncbi:hypothetical protein STAS_27015, partial [Striga asiatica]
CKWPPQSSRTQTRRRTFPFYSTHSPPPPPPPLPSSRPHPSPQHRIIHPSYSRNANLPDLSSNPNPKQRCRRTEPPADHTPPPSHLLLPRNRAEPPPAALRRKNPGIPPNRRPGGAPTASGRPQRGQPLPNFLQLAGVPRPGRDLLREEVAQEGEALPDVVEGDLLERAGRRSRVEGDPDDVTELGFQFAHTAVLGPRILAATSSMTSLVSSSPATNAATISIVKTALQLLPDTYPVSSGPTAAPIEPVPSIMAVTVAMAREFPCRQLWLPKSVETAVVISA